ncbi:hypothetical protein ACHAXA_005201, partial [Cyclostephanos tholiformis]
MYLGESAAWIEDRRRRRDEAKKEVATTVGRWTVDDVAAAPKAWPVDDDGGFVPPRRGQGEDSAVTEPVISLTMSSLTMRSKFISRRRRRIVKMGGAFSSLGVSFETMLFLRHYGVRLLGTSTTWLMWDISYYGNKLFQSSFIVALTGEDASLLAISVASTINSFVALMGYYSAAAIVDDPDVGRLALQQVGFVITGTLFLLCGALDDQLSSKWLVVLYFLASFFGQCGPNCTTYLIPAEVFPTNMLTICHGISAASGKLGAIIASILFHYLSVCDLFLLSGCASLAAAGLTFLTLPETTTLDLHEIDKQWANSLSGAEPRYEGPAIDPRH